MQPVTPAQKLRLFGKRGQSQAPGVDPDWWKRFQFGGVNPAAVLDFANGLYWDGTLTTTDPSSMVGGSPTITAGSGLLCNSSSITGIGNLLTAAQGSAYNFQVATYGGTNGSTLGIIQDNAVNMILGENAGGGFMSFRHSDSSNLPISTSTDFTKGAWGSLSNASGIRRISSVGVGNSAAGGTAAADANSYASPMSLILGSWNGANEFGGFIAQLAVIRTTLPAQVIPPAAFTGPNGWWWAGDAANSKISYGNVLQYEYTHPWTVICAVCCLFAPNSGPTGVTGMMFTNVPDPANAAFPGYEFWINGDGRPHVRLMHIAGAQFVGVYGSTNVADGKWHVLAASYDGSGLAAGVKIYLDGALETVTVESDTLGGNTIKSTDPLHPNNYLIGNQTGEPFAMPGAIGLFRQFNTVKSQAYIQQYKINQLIPAIDSSCVLAPKLNEGGSNTTTGDLSGSGLTGTLSSSSVWLRG